VHGLRACAALFAHRPGDIIRVYLSVNRRPTFKALLEYCVAQRLGFQFVDDENLQKLSGGIHHEGIVILAREPARLGGDELLAGISTKTIHGPLLLLDGVQNPHNLGSILRSAAHFGCGAVVGEAENLPPLSAAALRVAEGGAESVPLVAVEDAAAFLAKLKSAGLRVVSTTSRAGTPIAAAGLSRHVVLVLGSEAEGVSPRVGRGADIQVRIPGSGAVQSLNVAVACGIVLAEACRGDGGTAAVQVGAATDRPARNPGRS
jgi:TrmH RNA methyltransferase